MAGLDEYERVYRGRPLEPWEAGGGYPSKYHDREVIRPLDIPVVHPLAQNSPPPDDDTTVKKYVGLGCGLASLITENLLIHPFIVLRRQCQVNPVATKYHLVPITLVPVIIRLHQSQGLNILWKGIGSVLLVRGLTLAVEDLVSKVTPWPKAVDPAVYANDIKVHNNSRKESTNVIYYSGSRFDLYNVTQREITCNSSLRAFGQHLLLKCVAIGIVSPFYSASLVETVQSEIASERPGIFDVFRDGAIRLLEVTNKGRLIPIYALLPATVACGLAKYLFALIVRGVTSRIMHIRHKHSQEATGAYSRDLVSETVVQDIELHSALISTCAADVVFYPLETVILRLHLQGTRTIIDNLDNGRSVTPLLTGYSGAVDCYRTIISTEGPLGLYKGFGALILQFAAHVLVLRTTKWIITEITSMLRPKPKLIKPQHSYYNEI